MFYSNVCIESFGYELAPNVITSEDLEKKLAPIYEKLHLKVGQIEALTGIRERRFWDIEHTMHEGAIRAGQKAIDDSEIYPEDIGMLIYGSVCRDNLEPATACAVADGLGLGPDTQVFDISNACLGGINGIMQIANAIELGQIRAGLVVCCETARQIVESTIERICDAGTMEMFKTNLATLTGGSGAAGILLVEKSLSVNGHNLMGGIVKNATEHHKLCTWGPDTGMPASGLHIMETDAVGVFKNGVALGTKTFLAFKDKFSLPENKPDKIVMHQVGEANQNAIRKAMGIPEEKDFSTYQFLGNMGTASLPVTAAIANERDFFAKDDFVGMFGIGSGLNCLMLGINW